jgi:two-component system sensor histidine kinase RegB
MAEEASLAHLVKLALEVLPGRERVVVDFAPSASDATIVVPPRATSQALRNVLKNGLDASSDDATILLRVTRDGNAAGFTVIDEGSGMSDEVLAHATEPFFTTKEPGRGMGLGLFLTRSVVGLLGGTFGIESKLGSGTRVAITLPQGSLETLGGKPGAVRHPEQSPISTALSASAIGKPP